MLQQQHRYTQQKFHEYPISVISSDEDIVCF